MIKILPVLQWATLLARSKSPSVLVGIAASVLLGFGLVAVSVGPSRAVAGFREQAEWITLNEKPWHLVARGGDLRPNNESLPIVLARTLSAIPEENRPKNVVVLARLPLNVIWTSWGVIVGVLGLTWLLCIRPAGRLEPARGWLGMFALTSILMLAATPICWHHYFLWTLPAALFLIERPAVVFGYATVSIIGSAIPQGAGWGSTWGWRWGCSRGGVANHQGGTSRG